MLLITFKRFIDPHVDISPNTTTAILGETVNFTCTVTNSVSETVIFEWKLNSTTLPSDLHAIIEPSHICSGVKCTSILYLMIPELGNTSQSLITCSARGTRGACTTFDWISVDSTLLIITKGSQLHRSHVSSFLTSLHSQALTVQQDQLQALQFWQLCYHF